uniref:Uncharacterized protein n=1 Tax=Timema shepardi TaxID=629360 RepID=A0A7R9B6H4_TIMSH|nr:unnamed protein product [Timema shepardi]
MPGSLPPSPADSGVSDVDSSSSGHTSNDELKARLQPTPGESHGAILDCVVTTRTRVPITLEGTSTPTRSTGGSWRPTTSRTPEGPRNTTRAEHLVSKLATSWGGDGVASSLVSGGTVLPAEDRVTTQPGWNQSNHLLGLTDDGDRGIKFRLGVLKSLVMMCPPRDRQRQRLLTLCRAREKYPVRVASANRSSSDGIYVGYSLQGTLIRNSEVEGIRAAARYLEPPSPRPSDAQSSGDANDQEMFTLPADLQFFSHHVFPDGVMVVPSSGFSLCFLSLAYPWWGNNIEEEENECQVQTNRR